MPSRSIMRRVSTACFMLPSERVRLASNGVVCAAAPSYAWMPAKSHVGQPIDGTRQVHRGRARADAGAAEVQVDGQIELHAGSGRLGRQLASVLLGLDDEDGVGRQAGEHHRARDLRRRR